MPRNKPAFSPSTETAKIAAMMTRWHHLVDLHKNADLWLDANRLARLDARMDRSMSQLTERIVSLGAYRLGNPARSLDDITARALLALHMSAERGLFADPATPSAIRQGSAAWELPRAIVTMAGFQHLAR